MGFMGRGASSASGVRARQASCISGGAPAMGWNPRPGKLDRAARRRFLAEGYLDAAASTVLQPFAVRSRSTGSITHDRPAGGYATHRTWYVPGPRSGTMTLP